MAGSLNRATLIGHLGADVEIRRTQDGRSIANFRVATSESWRDKNSGERREKTEWHTVVCYNEGLAGVAEKYLRKGSKVLVEGQIQTRKWQDKDGNDRYSTEIVLQGYNSQLILLDGREGNGGGRNDRDEDRRGGRDDDYGSRSRGDDRGRSRSDDYRGGDSRQDRQRSSQRNDIDDSDIPF